jgi:hypothetical protein
MKGQEWYPKSAWLEAPRGFLAVHQISGFNGTRGLFDFTTRSPPTAGATKCYLRAEAQEMFQLESTRIGINIVNVLFQRGDAHNCNRTTPIPAFGQRAVLIEQS